MSERALCKLTAGGDTWNVLPHLAPAGEVLDVNIAAMLPSGDGASCLCGHTLEFFAALLQGAQAGTLGFRQQRCMQAGWLVQTRVAGSDETCCPGLLHVRWLEQLQGRALLCCSMRRKH